MSNCLHKAMALLNHTWRWTLFGVPTVALLVWWAGYLLSVNGHRVWADPVARLLSISGVVLLWGLAMAFVSGRAGLRKKNEAEREALGGDAACNTLQKRFRQALYTLKDTCVHLDRPEHWRDELPWLMVLGPPGAGKARLLDVSGLEFARHTLDGSPTRDLRSTLDCEWYFAELGGLVGTAGGCLPSGIEPRNASDWRTLPSQLRKRTRGGLLNGVLVTIPVDTLMLGRTDTLSGLSDQIRARLQDVHEVLRIELPVYLVLTKTDLIPGFTEFFEPLPLEERARYSVPALSRGRAVLRLCVPSARRCCSGLTVRSSCVCIKSAMRSGAGEYWTFLGN